MKQMNEFQSYGFELAKELLNPKYEYDNNLNWELFNNVVKNEYEKLLAYCGIIGDSIYLPQDTPNPEKELKPIFSNDKVFEIDIKETSYYFERGIEKFLMEYPTELQKNNPYECLPPKINIKKPKIFKEFMLLIIAQKNNLKYIEYDYSI